MRREHVHHARTLREREQRMRQTIRDEYKKTMAIAQQEADEMLANAQQQCAQWNADSEKLRLDALEEIHERRSEIEHVRHSVLELLRNAGDAIGTSSAALDCPPPFRSEEKGEQDEQTEHIESSLPEQRDDVQTFTFPLEQQPPQGVPAVADPVRVSENGDTARRN
jgi:hypothetical protein